MLGNVALVFVYIPFKPKSTHKFIVLAMVFMSTLGLNATLRVSYAANLLRRMGFWRVKQLLIMSPSINRQLIKYRMLANAVMLRIINRAQIQTIRRRSDTTQFATFDFKQLLSPV